MDKSDNFVIFSYDLLEQVVSPGGSIRNVIRDNSGNSCISPRPPNWHANHDLVPGSHNSYTGNHDEMYHTHPQRKSSEDWPIHCELPAPRGCHIPRFEGSSSSSTGDTNGGKLACETRPSFKCKRYRKSHLDVQHESHYSRSDGSPRLAPLKHRTLMMEGNHIRKELEREGILSASNNEHEDPDIVLRELRHMGLVKNVRDAHSTDLTFEPEPEIQHVNRLPPINPEHASRITQRNECQTSTSRIHDEGSQPCNTEQEESADSEVISSEEDEESETIAKLKYMMFHLDLV